MIEEHDRSAGRFNGFRNFDCLTFTNKILLGAVLYGYR